MTNPARTSVLVSLESIQQQIEHCENIVNNIDKLVPNLYKIRQQALAQKNYISDIHHVLMSNNNQLKTEQDRAKVRSVAEGLQPGITSGTEGNPGYYDGPKNIPGNPVTNPIVLSVSVPSTNVTDQQSGSDAIIKYKNKQGDDITKNPIADLTSARNVIQSLCKFKHDQGTSVHFTTQQIDATANGDIRSKGLNLSDVESITDGLNDYLSISDNTFPSSGTTSVELTKIQNTLLKLFAPVGDTTGESFDHDSIDSVDGDISQIEIFKAPLTGSSGTVNKALTKERSAKSRRIPFTGNVPDINELKKIVTFGLT